MEGDLRRRHRRTGGLVRSRASGSDGTPAGRNAAAHASAAPDETGRVLRRGQLRPARADPHDRRLERISALLALYARPMERDVGVVLRAPLSTAPDGGRDP